MLTDKREKFVQNLNAGLSQRQAYREAYPKSRKWKDSTVDKRASELLKNGEVLGRYQELQKEKAEDRRKKNLWSYEDSVKGLKWVIIQAQIDIQENGFRQANSSAFINAVKELNDLVGLGEPREAKIELDRVKIDKIRSEINADREDTQEEKVAELLEGVIDAYKETK
jgi:hypothetical protein